MVLAPFLTAIDFIPSNFKPISSRPIHTGIMVNLGWVPVEKRQEISTEPPVEPIEFNEDMFNEMQCTLTKSRQDETGFGQQERRRRTSHVPNQGRLAEGRKTEFLEEEAHLARPRKFQLRRFVLHG
jgi:hypothetical protein